MDDPGTDTLHKLAPSWTLAGDEQLLNILQSTHQKLLSKCQEANSKLEEMATALNDANISLQNVNNQFMALSSSQFIESRVYDDDDVAADEPAVKEPPKPDIPDELSCLKRSIAVLENAHEIITILHDSDTESDSDDDMPARVVLKPKDMYADRPLPYIIGSEPWKNKWHAGLLVEDSDSDSSASKVEQDSDQYSQSEPEDTQTDKLRVPDTHTTISETSSELPSELGSVPKPTPSDVASEIARRLGATQLPPKMVEKEAEYDEPAEHTTRKIYRPQDPVSSTIFPDEPPPLSEHSDSQDSDIFADLHRSQPYARSQIPDDLFDHHHQGDSDDGDIFSDFASKPVSDPSAKPTSLFDAGPTPHMFDNPDGVTTDTRNNNRNDVQKKFNDVNDEIQRKICDIPTRRGDDGSVGQGKSDGRAGDGAGVDRVKKPIGGISLFGNKGTESIGAAILKRNQRKSSTSGSESDTPEPQTNQTRKEKDIFDDLFARSEGKAVKKDTDLKVKDIKTEIEKKRVIKDKSVDKPKVDLFSDNLFDDIDDIFSSNIVKVTTKDTKTKSIFEDDDDLFSEIAAPKPMKTDVASSSKKGLFDSDDELFSENITTLKSTEKPKVDPVVKNVSKPEIKDISKIKVTSETKVTKSIFDDDEDDIFSGLKTNKLTESKIQKDEPIVKTEVLKSSSKAFKSPSLFDDDDDSDLFTENKSSKNTIIAVEKPVEKTETVIPERKPVKNVETKNVTTEKMSVIEDIPSREFEKSEKFEQNDNLIKESSTKEINVNKIIDNKLEESSVSKDVDSINKNLGTNAAKIFDQIPKNIQNESSSDTNDFSDQDFDDLPPKIQVTNTNLNINTNLSTETKNNEIPTNIDNIFDKEVERDEIFAKPAEIIFNEEPFVENIHKPEKTDKDNNRQRPTTNNIEPDIFGDILTEPPVFEKPTEPKKSKNVNALFDDDSDDESLFFKKNDPVFEENPEKFTPGENRIFGLFTDEPPDDDFSKISDDIDDDIFSTLPNPKIPENDNLPPIPDNFEHSVLKNDTKVPDFEKSDAVDDIFGTRDTEASNIEQSDTTEDIFSANKAKTVIDIHKELSLDKDKDSNEKKIEKGKSPISSDDELFKLPTNVIQPNLAETSNSVQDSDRNDTIIEKPDSPIPSDDEIFKLPSNVIKPSIPEKPNTEKTVIKKSPIPSDDELFKLPTTAIKQTLPEKSSPDILSDNESLFATVPKLESRKSEMFKNLDSVINSDEELFASLPTKIEDKLPEENLFKKPRTPETQQTEPKKVGKLKVGLNINVNALLPGASPKKVKPNDLTDGQTHSAIETPKSPISDTENKKSDIPGQNADSNPPKSVSFDGKPESDILDNKLSKERAKIQVKRRPSTRKARREAVRKSAIDFGEDSTDNSSSIDDPPRIQPELSKDDIIIPAKQSENIDNSQISKDIHIEQNIDTKNIEKSKDEALDKSKIQPKLNEKDAKIQPETNKQAEIPDKTTRDIKSKVVYILNDEDIFNTKPETSKNLDSNPGISTLGKVYEKNDTKKSIFDDENGDEIFKSKPVVNKKSNIFDSDSEDELFGVKKDREKERVVKKEPKREVKREVVKSSLFGDDDDDDDLFAVKTKKTVEQKPRPSRSSIKESPAPPAPVFEDPLSMFDDDD